MSKQLKTKCCASNNHTFIVSAWKVSANKQTAVEYTCQACLHRASRQELEVLEKERLELAKGP